MKAYISNGWDSRIVDPDPDKQYTQRKAAIEQCHDGEAEDSVLELSNGKCWPKGPYTQQIEGVLPAVLTEEIIMTHLQSSGRRLKKSESFSNQLFRGGINTLWSPTYPENIFGFAAKIT